MLHNSTVPFIMEGGINTSYISALFCAMFYKLSPIQNILSTTPENIKFYYLQELIYTNIVNYMRFHYVIESSSINEIRNYMIMCGWKQEQNITDLYEIQELYVFLAKGFLKSSLIECNVNNEKHAMNYIELQVENNNSIDMLINNYFDENLKQFTFDIVPEFIPIYLNRNNDFHTNYFIDIKRGISMYKYNTNPTQKYVLWDIHSIICLSRGENTHYYTIICDRTTQYMFDDTKIPSMFKIDIKIEELATRIKQECVFILYVINNSELSA